MTSPFTMNLPLLAFFLSCSFCIPEFIHHNDGDTANFVNGGIKTSMMLGFPKEATTKDRKSKTINGPKTAKKPTNLLIDTAKSDQASTSGLKSCFDEDLIGKPAEAVLNCKNIIEAGEKIYTVNVEKLNAENFKSWAREKVMQIDAHVLVENTQLDELLFGKLKAFTRGDFSVKNNSKLTKVGLVVSGAIENTNTLVSKNPKLESISLEAKTLATNTLLIEENDSLNSLIFNSSSFTINQKFSISRNLELKSFKISANMLISNTLLIEENDSLNSLIFNSSLFTIYQNFSISRNSKPKSINISATTLATGNMFIEDNTSLDSLKFSIDKEFNISHDLSLKRNPLLKLIDVNSQTMTIKNLLIDDVDSLNTMKLHINNYLNIDQDFSINRNSLLEVVDVKVHSLTINSLFVEENKSLKNLFLNVENKFTINEGITISRNPNLAVIDFNHFTTDNKFIKIPMKVHCNDKVNTIVLPKTKFEGTLALDVRGNRMLPYHEIEYVRNYIGNDTANLQDVGECIFDNPVSKLEDLHDCRYIYGNLTITVNATGSTNVTLAKITGNLTLHRNITMDFLNGTVVEGQVVSTICDFNSSAIPVVSNKTRASSCVPTPSPPSTTTEYFGDPFQFFYTGTYPTDKPIEKVNLDQLLLYCFYAILSAFALFFISYFTFKYWKKRRDKRLKKEEAEWLKDKKAEEGKQDEVRRKQNRERERQEKEEKKKQAEASKVKSESEGEGKQPAGNKNNTNSPGDCKNSGGQLSAAEITPPEKSKTPPTNGGKLAFVNEKTQPSGDGKTSPEAKKNGKKKPAGKS